MADMRQSSQVYMKTFEFMLNGMSIIVQPFMTVIQNHHSIISDTHRIMQLKLATKSVKSRISLRGVLANSTHGTSVCADMSTNTFQSFCDAVRFPNSMPNLVKLRCYLLAAQQHCFEYSDHTEALVTGDVAKLVNDNPVVFPDVKTLCRAISSLTINKVTPFWFDH